MNKQQKAFTLVELIVVITILAILWTIAFISMEWYSKSSRDSVRISDVSNMKTSLELFHLNAGKYPLPDNNEIVEYETQTLWYQWKFWSTVVSNLSRNLNEIPTDPLTDKQYIFSVANNRNEFEILSLLEWDLALNTITQTNAANLTVTPRIDWTYNGVFIKTAWYIVPTPSIVTAEDITWWITLNNTNIQSQVTNLWDNIPDIWNVNSNTWWLDIVLSVYTWSIASDSSDTDKASVMEAIQWAYTWSILANDDIYKYILSVSWETELAALLDTVVLKGVITVGGTLALTIKTVSDCTTGWELLYWTEDGTDSWLTCTDDIIVCSWAWTWYTLASCNAWADTLYASQTFAWSSTARDAGINTWAGWMYQWWNNADNSYTTTQWSKYLATSSDSTFSNPFFISDFSFNDWANPSNKNLWWENTNTLEARKWPCNVWYHVPKYTELTGLISAWDWAWKIWDISNTITEGEDFMNALKAPMAGFRDRSSWTLYSQNNTGYFLSSSTDTTPGSYDSYILYFSSNTIMTASNSRVDGFSVRCFKN
jgi:prepilin-type N-terminal cleavage/methylation domain-containing protein